MPATHVLRFYLLAVDPNNGGNLIVGFFTWMLASIQWLHLSAQRQAESLEPPKKPILLRYRFSVNALYRHRPASNLGSLVLVTYSLLFSDSR